MRTKKNGILILLFCFLIYAFNDTGILKSVISSLYPNLDFWNTYLNLIFYGLFFLLFFIVYSKDLLELFKAFCADRKRYSVLIAKTFILITGAMFLCTSVLFFFGVHQSGNQTALESAMQQHRLVVFIDSVVLAPFVEEMLFRFHLFNFLIGKQRNLRKTAFIISSLCFALYHTTLKSIFTLNYMEMLSVIPFFFVGLGLARLQEQTDNILCPVFTHMTYNLLATVLLFT